MSAEVDELIGEYDIASDDSQSPRDIIEEEEEVTASPSKAASGTKKKAAKRDKGGDSSTVVRKRFVPARERRRVMLLESNAMPDEAQCWPLTRLYAVKGAKARSGQFLLHDNALMEVQRMSQWPCSWLLDESVESDGGLYMCTRYDPLLLLVPRLQQVRKKTEESAGVFVGADEVLDDAQLKVVFGAKVLADYPLELVCDVSRSDGGSEFFRLNDDKLAEYVAAKVTRVAEHLRDYERKHGRLPANVARTVDTSHIFKLSGASSNANNTRSASEYREMGAELMAECVSHSCFRAACALLGITDIDHVLPRRAKPKSIGGMFASLAAKQAGDAEDPDDAPISTKEAEVSPATARRRMEAFMAREKDLKQRKADMKAKKAAQPAKPLARGQKTMASFFSMPAKKKAKK